MRQSRCTGWERGGPPELAIEIVSPTEGTATSESADELASYLECGVNELVRFDPAANEGERPRVWDRVEDDRLERIVVGGQPRAPRSIFLGSLSRSSASPSGFDSRATTALSC